MTKGYTRGVYKQNEQMTTPCTRVVYTQKETKIQTKLEINTDTETETQTGNTHTGDATNTVPFNLV